MRSAQQQACPVRVSGPQRALAVNPCRVSAKARAAGIGEETPEPTLGSTPDRGEPGRSVRIERSRDLVNWEYAGAVPIPACGQTLIDPAATAEPHLFYRAMRVP